jgi:hypothetical protein
MVSPGGCLARGHSGPRIASTILAATFDYKVVHHSPCAVERAGAELEHAYAIDTRLALD